MRYILDIAYKGTKYHGWQIQANAHSVQAEINQKLKILLGYEIETTGSGRTDTGVHAEHQIAHFDTQQEIDMEQLKYKLNIILPNDIHINRVAKVDGGFHARFDAISRTYEYRISRVKNPFLTGLSYYFYAQVNINLMKEASAVLLDYNDYQCFSKVKTETGHFLCDVHVAQWIETGNQLIFQIQANRFLRGMVRAVVGTLLNVGLERTTLAQFEEIIRSKDRKMAGRAVPSEGLLLTKVEYPPGLISF